MPERINFRLCVLINHCLHEGEPAYLAESVCRTFSRNVRRHMRFNDTVTLLVPPTRRSTLGDRAFAVAAARAWNALLAHVGSALSLSIFRRQLMFSVSLPEQSDYYYSDLPLHARFLSHFILFLYFYTVVLQQFHATVPLLTYTFVIIIIIIIIITLQCSRCLGYLCPHNPRGRNVT